MDEIIDTFSCSRETVYQLLTLRGSQQRSFLVRVNLITLCPISKCVVSSLIVFYYLVLGGYKEAVEISFVILGSSGIYVTNSCQGDVV